jgi:thiol-disulfide isomerase/thioredoxin
VRTAVRGFRPAWLPLLGLAAVLPAVGATEPPKPAPADEVRIQSVKFAGLDKFLGEQRGKVVVVDVWASWCTLCMEEFPGLVKVHERYAKDGVVCVSVTVDGAEKEAVALGFLKKKKATFTNFRLDEPDEVWAKRFGTGGLPLFLVYDREGRKAHQFDIETPGRTPSYEHDVEPAVRKLLGLK